MKHLLLAAALLAPVLAEDDEWTALLDPDLARWEIFMGVPHKSVVVPGFPQSTSEDCRKGTPVGLGKDPLGVFKMIEEDGEPVLHISGQIYAGLSTLEEFENYHLKWQFKWGEKKWPPREHILRDSGILIHCVGKHGAFWDVWMRSLECQVQEGDCGDFIALGGTAAKVQVSAVPGKKRPVYDPGGQLCRHLNYISHSPSKESPHGEWNTMEVYTLGQTSVFIVNGTPNMVLFDTTQKGPRGEGWIPLTKGRIQIQSEAAEIFYRGVKIRPLTAFPDSLKAITTRPAGEAVTFNPPADGAGSDAPRKEPPPPKP